MAAVPQLGLVAVLWTTWLCSTRSRLMNAIKHGVHSSLTQKHNRTSHTVARSISPGKAQRCRVSKDYRGIAIVPSSNTTRWVSRCMSATPQTLASELQALSQTQRSCAVRSCVCSLAASRPQSDQFAVKDDAATVKGPCAVRV